MCIYLMTLLFHSSNVVDLNNRSETKKYIIEESNFMAGGRNPSVKVAKTVASKSLEDESIKTASDDTRRRIAVANANSRVGANKAWTALSTGVPHQTQKTTLG